MTKKRVFILLILVIGFIYQSTYMRSGMNMVDEGIIPCGAKRMLSGQVLYRDSYTWYMPGEYFSMALVFKLFGNRLITYRIFKLLMTLGLGIVVFLLSRKLMSDIASFLTATLIVISGGIVVYGHILYAYLYNVFPLLGLFLWMLYYEKKHVNLLFWSGVFSGIALMYRLVPGVACISAVLFTCGYLYVTEKNRTTLNHILYYFIGLSCAILPFFLYLLLNRALIQFIEIAFIDPFKSGSGLKLPFIKIFPTRDMGNFRDNWFEIFKGIQFYSFIPIYVGSFVYLIYSQIKKKIKKPDLYILMITIFGSIMTVKILNRPDYAHIMQVYVPMGILVVYYTYNIFNRIINRKLTNVQKYIIIASIMISYLFIQNYDKDIKILKSSFTQLYSTEEGIYLNKTATEKELIEYIKSITKDNESIFVASWQPLIYFLADRNNPTRYDWLLKGFLYDNDNYSKIVDSLESNKIKYIIYADILMDNVMERSITGFAKDLFDYMINNFSIIKRIGDYCILERNNHIEKKEKTDHISIGNSYYNNKNYGEAIKSFNKALSEDSTNIFVYNSMIASYAQTQQYEKAISLFKKGINMNVVNADMYKNIGLVYKIMGNYKQTIIHWKKYLQLSPNAPDAEAVKMEIENIK